MVSKSTSNINNLEKGITLIEIIVVLFLVVMFTSIIIVNFPKILRQMALSRVTYKLGQDLRKTQDLGLSGVQLNDRNMLAIDVKGYGIYIGNLPTKEYFVYANVDGDQKYGGGLFYPLCSDVNQGVGKVNKLTTDCVVEKIDVSKENASLYIDSLAGTRVSLNSVVNITSGVSINSTPPNPTTKIEDDSNIFYSDITINLKNTDGLSRQVQANTSGLIDVQ